MSPLQFGQDLVKVSEPEATIGYFVRSTAAIELWPTTPSRIPAGRQKARDRRSPRAPCRALWRAESRAWEMSSTGLFGGWSKALAACQFNDVSACSRWPNRYRRASHPRRFRPPRGPGPDGARL